MITEQGKTFLRRAMRLAMNGRGHVEPNPMVGCVLVKNDQTIGEGWHKKYGEAHAEPTALNDCKSRGNDPTGATAYVTLEPCCHTNKKTPPCAPRLIEAKITRVVIGCLDPNPDVNGKGVAMLREAGIEVDCLPGANPSGPLAPVLGGDGQGEGERAGKVQVPMSSQVTTSPPQPSPPGTGERELDASHFQQLIAPFTLRQNFPRPYITMKWAETADGKVAGLGGERLAITGHAANVFVHRQRATDRVVMVGINTILSDDPLLNARLLEGDMRHVVRIVLDSNLRIPTHAKVVTTNYEPGYFAFTTVVTTATAIEKKPEKAAVLKQHYVAVLAVPHDHRLRLRLDAAVTAHTTPRLFVEPGPTLARSFFKSDLCDRLIVIRSPNALGKSVGVPTAPSIPPHFLPVATLNLAGDILTEYLNTQSPAYFAPVPSADFVLAQEGVARASGT